MKTLIQLLGISQTLCCKQFTFSTYCQQYTRFIAGRRWLKFAPTGEPSPSLIYYCHFTFGCCTVAAAARLLVAASTALALPANAEMAAR
jgi:hypothetical protein